MPGYPTSCLSNAYLLLVPCCAGSRGCPSISRTTVRLPLARRVVSTTGRHQFYTVRLVDGTAVPAFKASGDITSMSHADGYIEIPAQTDIVEAGRDRRGEAVLMATRSPLTDRAAVPAAEPEGRGARAAGLSGGRPGAAGVSSRHLVPELPSQIRRAGAAFAGVRRTAVFRSSPSSRSRRTWSGATSKIRGCRSTS